MKRPLVSHLSWSRVGACFLVAACLWVAVGSSKAVAQLPPSAPSAPAQAAPRRVLVLAPAGEARLARTIGAKVRDRAIATLGARGLTAARGPASCAEPDCAAELLGGGAAEHALAIALWGRARCDRVAVTLVDAQGVAHGGEAVVSGADVGAAVDAAVDAALTHLANGGSSPLRVSGAPEGATITLDQIPWGTLPHEDRVPHGEHQLAVSADGFVTERRSVAIGTAPVAVEIALARAEAAPPHVAPDQGAESERAGPAPQPSTGADGGLLALGGVTAGLGVALVVPGLFGLTTGDGPVTPDLAYERTNVPVSATYLALGTAALVGGVVLLVMGATGGGPAPAHAADLRRGVLRF